MATSTIEQLRQYSEDIENLEKAGSKLLAEKETRTGAKAVVIDHLIKIIVDRTCERSKDALALFADKDGLRKDEIAVLAGAKKARSDVGGAKGGEAVQARDVGVWTNFYDKLKDVKDYNRRNASAQLSMPSANHDAEFWVSEMLKHEAPRVESLFSTEEDTCKRVDLSSAYLKFTNLSKFRRYREQEHRKGEVARLLRRRRKQPVAGGAEQKEGDDVEEEPQQPAKDCDEEEEGDDGGEKKKNAGQEETLNINDPEVQRQLEFDEIDYITYLKTFDRFHEIPRYCKYRDTEYLIYIQSLLDYLTDFFKRQNPLVDDQKVMSQVDFDSRWSDSAIQGWSSFTHKLPFYSLPVDRLFASGGTFANHQKGKKHQKAIQALQVKSMEEQKTLMDASESHDEQLARIENLIQFYRDLVAASIERTVEHLQKKQSRSIREIMGEPDEEEEEGETEANVLDAEDSDDDDSDEDDKPIYNPLNLPLGWDGKPIPFWLYKLHGLGQEYKCEICGNYSYWGRRAFERHFQEWRHAFGMRCLKIPNTAHFKEVTKIEDAITLYEKLKHDAEIHAFIGEQDVECEDSEGNVMSAKAYDDLRRQGLL